jgi:beta-galactosidase GanA
MTSVTSGTAGELPHLRRQGQATQLVVDGRPFLMLGGELGNSSASSLDYLAPHWQTLEGLHLNTLLAPVYWELIEPREGVFDFSLLDGLLAEARRRRIRLVLLWFGSWKNSMSCYAPAWVKTDQERFPRARGSDGMALEILSPLGDASRDADARALAALPGRWLNGDQTHQGRHIRIPAGRVGTQRFELYRYR